MSAPAPSAESLSVTPRRLRVLFVDDETNVLEATRRAMYRMRGTWDLEFATGGLEALELLAEKPIDVLVSDMRMPGMDGWQLLAEVRRRHPQVIRMILSGYADQVSTLRTVGTAHQYLAKPCESSALQEAIGKALALRSALRHDRVADIVGEVELLPTTPDLFEEIIACLRRPNVNASEAARLIARDLAMTANILKLVNSAFFGTRQSFTRVERAVAYLGLDTVGALVLGHSIFNQHQASRTCGAQIAGLWQHSLQTASAASAISLCEQASTSAAEEAFLAGLLHDVGKIVLALRAPDSLGEQSLAAKDDGVASIHAEAGAYLLGLWGFPDAIVEAVGFHHQPSRAPSSGFHLPGIVHVANNFAHNSRTGAAFDESSLEPGYLDSLSLRDRVPIWQRAITERSLQDTSP